MDSLEDFKEFMADEEFVAKSPLCPSDPRFADFGLADLVLADEDVFLQSRMKCSSVMITCSSRRTREGVAVELRWRVTGSGESD
jgi:hypothetical protein